MCISIYGSSQRGNQEITSSDASNGEMENFHEKPKNVCKCSDLIAVAIPISPASPSTVVCPFVSQAG